MATGTRGKRRGDSSDKQQRSGEYMEKVVKIKRCAAVVKGGRRFSFAAMVVVGDGKGKVGWGYGKANEVPPSVEKAVKEGMRNMVSVALSARLSVRLTAVSAWTIPVSVRPSFVSTT